MRKDRDIRETYKRQLPLVLTLLLLVSLLLSACDTDAKDTDDTNDTQTAQISVNETIKEGETPTIIVRPAGDDSAQSDSGSGQDDSANGDNIEDEGTENADGTGNDGGNATDNSSEAGQAASNIPTNGTNIGLDPSWQYASFSKINSGAAVFYSATANRKGITVGVNAGHGTKGGGSVKTYCHPDMTPKVTGGSTAAGSIEATAVSGGMSFNTGEAEAGVNLRLARFLRDELLSRGYDVLMIRDGDDVQLDNIARTVICNNMAACHIAIHFDGDGTGSDKGCFFSSVPDGLKGMEPVNRTWQMSEELGSQIVTALSNHGHKLYHGGSMDIDLTQTSYSSVPSVDVEYGNQCSDTSDANLKDLAAATADGVEGFFLVSN